jgi:hypothetical protein
MASEPLSLFPPSPSSGASPATSSLLDEIARLEAELHHPGTPCTRERIEQLLHPAFHEVGRSGRGYSRDRVIAYLTTPSAVPSPGVEASGHAVHPLAADCVLLTYRSARRVAADGTWADAALRSSVWRHTAGSGWQLFYHQGTPAFSDPG